MTDLSHLRLEGTAIEVPYTFAGAGGGGEFRLPPRDRAPHAAHLRSEVNQAQIDAAARHSEEGSTSDGDVITVRSDQGFELELDSLDRPGSGIALLSAKVEDGIAMAEVFVPRGKLVLLLRLIESYETKINGRSGQPRNRRLIESIASIRLAAIRDFWQDSIPFPEAAESIWWEVWLRASDQEPPRLVHARFAEMAVERGLVVSQQYVRFPERVVTLAYGLVDQLSGSIALLSLLAELRKAKEIATPYRDLSPREQMEWIQDLLSRLVPPPAASPAVCLLDSGVNREHPLLSPALAADDTHSVRAEWGTADDDSQHGTGMAGIALYGCLTRVFPTTGPVNLRHRLESVKILPPPPAANEARDYGPFTEQAVARAEIQAPNRSRALCMAITADARDLGTPSLWSGTVDQLLSGAVDAQQRLMFISAGNLREQFHQPGYAYHESNCATENGGIDDPGQSWNAVTVGAFTEKTFIRDDSYFGWNPIAPSGDLCPTSRTSIPWSLDWPIKPDVVLEGGNYAENGPDRSAVDDLSLLTTILPSGSEHGRLLTTTGDTSPATASAARMAAIIWSHYPRLRPETIRALLVHSARWTPKMLERYAGSQKAVVRERLRCYGYGVPDLQRALWSAENAATLVFEGDLSPYHRTDSGIQSNQMHVHRLPWPATVLEDLAEAQVTMRVTLSYYIEPSPGRAGWTRKHRYQSHGLRFDVNRPNETEAELRQRLSRAEWADPAVWPDTVEETRAWTVGSQGRRRGSIHSDWWTGNAADLAATNLVAIYPVTGWWRERPHLGRYDRRARYSLLVSIEAPEVDVDLYTPIANQATIVTEIER